MIKLLIYWFIYAFFGWIVETLYTSILEASFQDRGFLTMPIIPIYGFGAIIAIYFLKSISDDIVLIFMGGFILTSFLEYITSYVMEKIFHMRWWDYSTRKYNIHGRVCLRNSVFFGLLSVILVKIIHPMVIQVVALMNIKTLNMIAVILLIFVFIDFLHSILFSYKFSKIFRELNETKNTYDSSDQGILLNQEKKLKALNRRIHELDHRILKKYPVLKKNILTLIEEIKEKIDR